MALAGVVDALDPDHPAVGQVDRDRDQPQARNLGGTRVSGIVVGRHEGLQNASISKATEPGRTGHRAGTLTPAAETPHPLVGVWPKGRETTRRSGDSEHRADFPVAHPG